MLTGEFPARAVLTSTTDAAAYRGKLGQKRSGTGKPIAPALLQAFDDLEQVACFSVADGVEKIGSGSVVSAKMPMLMVHAEVAACAT